MSRRPWHPPSQTTLLGAVHLHEGLGLQCARCLHHAVAKLQVLLKGQRVDGQQGHLELCAERQQSEGWDSTQALGKPSLVPSVSLSHHRSIDRGAPSFWPSSSTETHTQARGPTSCMTLCLQLWTIFCRPLAKSISAG